MILPCQILGILKMIKTDQKIILKTRFYYVGVTYCKRGIGSNCCYQLKLLKFCLLSQRRHRDSCVYKPLLQSSAGKCIFCRHSCVQLSHGIPSNILMWKGQKPIIPRFFLSLGKKKRQSILPLQRKRSYASKYIFLNG